MKIRVFQGIIRKYAGFVCVDVLRTGFEQSPKKKQLRKPSGTFGYCALDQTLMVIPITMAILQHLNNPSILHCAAYNNFFREDYLEVFMGGAVAVCTKNKYYRNTRNSCLSLYLTEVTDQ